MHNLTAKTSTPSPHNANLCPFCGDTQIINYISTKQRQCTKCKKYWPWDPNKTGPQITHQR